MLTRAPLARHKATFFGLCLMLLCLPASRAWSQAASPAEEQLNKLLSDTEDLKKKFDKEKIRPPLEFFRSQVMPWDALPYIKANQWITLNVEMRANHDDYTGILETEAVPLRAMPIEIEYFRDARLLKAQRAAIPIQVMLPRIPRELNMRLVRPDAIRADEGWPATLRKIEPHQMLVVVLTKESNDAYAPWARYQAFSPASVDRQDPNEVDRLKYYRLVLPLDPEKPLLPSHPLTWSAISHVIWDAMPPDRLRVPQRQALLDWLHWGGQLIFIGGAGDSYEVLKDSFLAPYLPAEPTGESVLLKQSDLEPLAASYPPPVALPPADEVQPEPLTLEQAQARSRRYGAPKPIIPASNRPVYLATLRPARPGASVIPLGEGSPHVLGVEERVGRGRILMLGLSPTDPALASWPGLDSFVRRVVLRRPEEPKVAGAYLDERGFHPTSYRPLSGPQLSWYRLLSRDLGATEKRPPMYRELEQADAPPIAATKPALSPDFNQGVTPPVEEEAERPSLPVAEWLDSSGLPSISRKLLEDASGIKIPSSSFVLKVIVAYLIALVPLNWLICRYVLGRREWAWLIIPALALGFAVVVERAAAYDVGYNSACDEIDLMELQGGYPRAHVSRFASYYSSGRVRLSVSFPDDATALALPMDTGHFLRGEDVSTAAWRSSPVPALEGYQVQPRSLAMFRAEQMTNLSGTVRLATDEGPRRVVNETDYELRDAVIVDLNGPSDRRVIPLGTIGPGATVTVAPKSGSSEATASKAIDPKPVLEALTEHFEKLPESSGEIRLVAWMARPLGGHKLEPAVDRHRGFTAVVVHLRNGPPPSPDGAAYNSLAGGDTVETIERRIGQEIIRQPLRRRPRGQQALPGPGTPGAR
ncbi:MAG: hypothetical protein P4L84_08390 [Isosphaeraceae bacterium]|nr:hypothetical protein [Isosphaeraceae bacterium]